MKNISYIIICLILNVDIINAQEHCSFVVNDVSTIDEWNWQEENFTVYRTDRGGSEELTSPFFWQGGNGNIDLGKDYTGRSFIQVYDGTGKLITTKISLLNRTTLDLTAQAKGIYFIKIRQGDNISTQKLIIQ